MFFLKPLNLDDDSTAPRSAETINTGLCDQLLHEILGIAIFTIKVNYAKTDQLLYLPAL